jgi:hypothetical protein
LIYYIKSLFGFGYYSSVTGAFEYFDNESFIALFFALILATPFVKKGWEILMDKLSIKMQKVNLKTINEAVIICFLAFAVFFSVISIVSGTSAPFYYFRF